MTIEYGAIIGGISGGIITVLGYIFVTRWLNKKTEYREIKKEEKDKLNNHFSEIEAIIISPLLQFIDGLQLRNGYLEASSIMNLRELEDISNYPFPPKLGLEARDEYASFKAHFPIMEEQLRELNSKTLSHNETAKNFSNNIRDHIESDPNLPPIKPDNPPIEEKVIPMTVGYMLQNLYNIALGYKPIHDFNKATSEVINNFRMLRVGDTGFAIVSKENLEYCKSSFIKIQESKNLRDTALEINGSATQIITEFGELAKKLNIIMSRGLITEDTNYNFKPVNDCLICRELFTKIRSKS